jgi:hypothetical protein
MQRVVTLTRTSLSRTVTTRRPLLLGGVQQVRTLKYGWRRRKIRHQQRQDQSHADALTRKAGNARAALVRENKKEQMLAECRDVLLEAERRGIKNHIFSKYQSQVVYYDNLAKEQQ